MAYAYYRPDVGYVQGMSYMAAMLLLYMDAYEAFTCFANLLSNSHFITFLRMDMAQIRPRFCVFDVLFRENLPDLHKHFTQLEITPESYIIEWMLTLFSKSLHLDSASRVWDCYFMEGEVFLFRTALGILRYFLSQLLKGTFDHILTLLNHLPDDMDCDDLISHIRAIDVSRYDDLIRLHTLPPSSPSAATTFRS
eukprot:gnl/Hemi2/25043_TR8421_c0_g1_i1.p3 gnl/Hemi2/25043_TR8421_c0_g1~~gnl/Hemi2/25043_TR8421_c0_g1_i1.p3  ORF type:complete len:195 (+),score=53.60 gnl/Hemi2/25043_TR8421_c0_g1_i1:947-1531(+)